MPTLAPNWSTRVLEISATFTSSITCCGAPMASMLITRGPWVAAGAGAAAGAPPAAAGEAIGGRAPRWANAVATDMMLSAVAASATVPDRMMVSAAVLIWISFSSGSSAARRACSSAVSMVTAMSMMVASFCLFHKIRLVLPTDLPTMYSSLLLSRMTSAMRASPTDMRWAG